MAEILKEWLTERLKRPITWKAEEFGEMMKDGTVIATLLLSYHVINEEKHFLIRPSSVATEIRSNWKYLGEWLQDIGIYVSETEIKNIREGNGSALLRLFYQLFLHLDRRDRTNFIKRERQAVSSLVEKYNKRFEINKVKEESEPSVEDLSKPLLDERRFIDWQRKKAAEIKITYEFVKHKYLKSLKRIEDSKVQSQPCFRKSPHNVTNKMAPGDKIDINVFSRKHPCNYKYYTYEELMHLDEMAQKQKDPHVDTDWAKNYMANLHTKIAKKSEAIEFQKKLRNAVTNSLWDVSVGEEESKQDTQLAKKVMKLSQFEKQMCTQIMETKQQARHLARNRVQAEKEFSEERENQFLQYLDNIREQIRLEVAEIDFEKQRQIMLHKRLYAEKMIRKRQHFYEICYETVLSIVDYATKYGYFKKLIGEPIPDHFIHEWKTCYFKKQPVFDIYEPIDDLLKHPAEEEIMSEVEEIIRLELDRQEALNDSEFQEYNSYMYPWSLDLLLPNFDPESEDRKIEYLGSRILGHVVFKLFEMKYPPPPQPPPADLPPFESKAILRGIPDKSITLPMQTLLKHKKIHVVRVESAINYCLRKFKTEMIGCAEIELNYDKFNSTASDEEKRDLIKDLKLDGETYSKSSLNATSMFLPLPPNCKMTQTPKTIPEEEILFSNAAMLGQYAFEALNFGDALTDHLLSAMIIEYIKGQEEIHGFVIVNYPNTYREAQILEETFSGREPPYDVELDDKDDIYLEEAVINHRRKENDPFKALRVSRLVSNPHKKLSDEPFETYFTCYINLKETEDILQELVIWDLNEENSDLIDRFYAILGLNYSMYYETIDKDFLAQICKYIIGDYTLPLNALDTLFGENTLEKLEFPTTDDKRIKTRILKPEVAASKTNNKARRSKINAAQSKTIVEPIESKEELPNKDSDRPSTVSMQPSKSRTSELVIKILAGEEDWVYGDIPIVEKIGAALAKCWEEIERAYIHDLQQLFLAKRLQLNYLVPYCTFIKDKIQQIITAPSYKQDHVSRFQKAYNEFEDDWRDIDLSKNEWHCRIKELQQTLYNICDERKKFAEQQKTLLIHDHWVTEELITMANTYVSCMQAELNRSVLTYQILHDFYFSMLKRYPSNDRLQSQELTKIYRESDETSGSKRGGEDKLFRQLKASFLEMQMKNINIDFSNNPFNMIIENNVKWAIKAIKDLNDSFRNILSKEFIEISKIGVVQKRKDDDASQESDAEDSFKQNGLKCIEEWGMGVHGEMYRAILRIQVLQSKCYLDMKLFYDEVLKTFMLIQSNIDTYYMNEIKSVDRICKYFQMAVEECRKIPETLILEHDTFTIDPNILQLHPPREKPEPIVVEINDSVQFKISQLARLRTNFKIVAPTGLALQRALVYLLQDFLFFSKESCQGPVLPEIWKRIDPELVPKLVVLIYGETTYGDWRDFLIYCLNIRFPTVEELLDLRKRFRCLDRNNTELISRDDFLAEVLWFEDEFDLSDKAMQLRKTLIKHFLFELYETAENMMNYSAFLLVFCKSLDPNEGFAKALAVTVGQKVGYCPDSCNDVICNFIKLKQIRDEAAASAQKCAQEFADKLIDNVINYLYGTTIEELETQLASVSNTKKKKKNVSKNKLGSSSKTTKSKEKSLESKSKVMQSTTDIKITYICPPCAEEDKPSDQETSAQETVADEEEVEPAAEPDPSLAYAVPQTAIWRVCRVCLPWHFTMRPEAKDTPYVTQVEEVIKSLQGLTDNGDIYVSMFLTDPNVCKLIHKVKKFTIVSVSDAVKKVCIS